MSQGHLHRLDLSALHTTRLSRDDVYRSLSSRDDVYGSLECTMYTIQCISTHSIQFSSLYTTPLPRDLYAPYTHKIIIINSSQQTLHNIHSIQLSIHQLHVQSDLKRPCIVHIQLYIHSPSTGISKLSRDIVYIVYSIHRPHTKSALKRPCIVYTVHTEASASSQESFLKRHCIHCV